MVEKLKSALRQIPWSLVLRSALIGVGSIILHQWWFLVAAVVLYFYPDFRFLKGFFPFALIIFFGITIPPDPLGAIFLAVLSYTALGVRSFTFIDRPSAYEMLSFFVFFGLVLEFREVLTLWNNHWLPLGAILLGATTFFLGRGFSAYIGHRKTSLSGSRRDLAILLLGVLVSEITLIILFLPLPSAQKAALIFLFVGTLVELIYGYIAEAISRRRLLLDFSIFSIFLAVIVGSASWGL